MVIWQNGKSKKANIIKKNMKVNKYIFWKKGKIPQNIRTIYDSIASSAQVKKCELERKIRIVVQAN